MYHILRMTIILLISHIQEIHTDAEHCDTQITPECVRALYDFHYNFTVPEANSVAVGAYVKQQRPLTVLICFISQWSSRRTRT